jgi:GTP-binding protein
MIPTPRKGEIPGRRTGVLISNGDGEAVAYAIWNLRGPRADDHRSGHRRSMPA